MRRFATCGGVNGERRGRFPECGFMVRTYEAVSGQRKPQLDYAYRQMLHPKCKTQEELILEIVCEI